MLGLPSTFDYKAELKPNCNKSTIRLDTNKNPTKKKRNPNNAYLKVDFNDLVTTKSIHVFLGFNNMKEKKPGS